MATDEALVGLYADGGKHLNPRHVAGLRRVYDAAVAAERERCARIAETEPAPDLDETDAYDCGYKDAASDIATEIRGGE